MRQFVDRRLEDLREERKAELELCRKAASRFGKRDLASDVNSVRLAETGWGLLFAPQDAQLLRGPLAPLLERRRQAAAHLYREIEWDDAALLQQTLWLELGANPGQVDTERLPYYLLIVGGPEKISWRSQSLLGLDRAVGRVAFDHADDYGSWVKALLEAEDRGTHRPRRLVSFAPSNGDRATKELRKYLVDPLVEQAENGRLSKEIELDVWDDSLAHKEHLARLLGGDRTPAALVAACHGKGFSVDDPALRAHQGALIGQGWQPAKSPHSCEDDYFAACDLPEQPELAGLVAFFLACWGLGTPEKDDFAWVEGSQEHSVGEPFVAKLPQALMSKGALAVVGSVDRGWVHSVRWFAGGDAGENSGALRDSIKRFLDGQPIGHALLPVRRRYAKLAAWVLEPEERLKDGEFVSESVLEALWIAHNAARNFLLLGDPYTSLPSGQTTSTEPESTSLQNATISRSSTPRTTERQALSSQAPRPKILILWIRETRSLEGVSLEFRLEVDSHDSPPSAEPLSSLLEDNPEAVLASHFRDLEDAPPSQHSTLLTGIGVNLSRQLLPLELQQYLWDHQESLDILWIRGEADWIPWELLRLRDPNRPDSITQAFSVAFAVTRWPGLGTESNISEPSSRLRLRRLALIAPADSGLEAVDQETEYLQQLASHGLEMTALNPSSGAIQKAIEGGRFDAWHFAGHGGASGSLTTHRHLQLQGGDQLSATLIEGLDTASWRRDRPLVLLNACHSGLTGRSLVGPRQGLAHAFLRAGAGAVIGAQWAIDDEDAARFIESLYEALLEGQPIGAAVLRARRVLLNRGSGISGLAYALYANPTASLKGSSDSRDRGTRSRRTSGKPWRLAFTAIFLSGGLLASLYKPATPVELDLLVRQADLTLSEHEAQTVIDRPLPLDYLNVEGFGQLRLTSPPASSPVLEERSASDRWIGLDLPATLTALEPSSQLGLEIQEPTTFGPLRSGPGSAVRLRADLEGQRTVLRIGFSPETSARLTTPGSFELWADLVSPGGSSAQLEPMSRFLRQEQSERILFDISAGTDGSLNLLANLLSSNGAQGAPRVLLDQPLSIESVELFEPSLEGQPTSSIAGPGRIEIPGSSTVLVGPGDAVILGKLADFKILRITLEQSALRILLQGQAGVVQVGPQGATQDLRPTLAKRLLPGIPQSGLALGLVVALAALSLPDWIRRPRP